MDEMENKLSSILGNPQMMQQIMAMAQTMNASQENRESPSVSQEASPPPEAMPDPAMLQKIMGAVTRSGIDQNQRALLDALRPYLSQLRIRKLEKAMRAAKLASAASSFLGSSGLSLFSGR